MASSNALLHKPHSPSGKGVSPDYNDFEHLWRSIFPIGAKEKLMPMLTAYFDESGMDGKSPIVTVAGYVSTAEQWTEFDRVWKVFLANNGIKVFHATDLRSGWGEFTVENGWSKKRREMAFHIADNIIEKHVLYGAATYITIKDCEEVFPLKDENGKRRKYSAEYLLSGFRATNLIAIWANNNRYKEPIKFVFEDGAHGRGYLHDALRILKKTDKPISHLVGGISFEDKDDARFPQLQSADRLAHVTNATIKASMSMEDDSAMEEEFVRLSTKLKLGNINVLDHKNLPALGKILKEGDVYEKED